MRIVAIFLSAALMAQTPAPKTPATAGKPATQGKSAVKSSTPAKSATAKSSAAAEPALTTEDDKTLYALGLSVYKSLGQFDLSRAELDIVKRAMSDAAANKPAVEITVYGPKIGALAQARSARVAERQKAVSKAFLDQAAAEPGALKTTSGLVYRELKAGTGPSPKPTDTVKVNYRGTFVDGKEFDSSFSRNEPAQFALNQVIPCWTEGVQRMKVGGKAQLVCPSDIAYGDAGRPGIPGGATLVFEIELLEVSGAPAAPAPPAQ